MASSAKDIQLRELKDTVSQLKTMVSKQTELIKSLRFMIDEKSSHEKALQEQVDYLTKKFFGSSSERRSDDIPGQQNLFDEAEMEQDPSLLEEESVIREHTRKKKATHEDLLKGLKVEKVVIPLPEEEQVCPVCGTQMVLIGEEYVRRELEFIPAICKVIEYYSQSYGCPSCKEGLGDTEKPVLEAFWSWLNQQKPIRNTRMDKAVNYVLNPRDTAETYLEDGRCSFTNNLSENAIRPFAVGRKN